MPTPRNPHPVPVRSTGASEALGGLEPVLAALAAPGLVVDLTLEGLMHARETPAILGGGARILHVSNEHPEALERLRPDPALETEVRAAARLLRAAQRMTRDVAGRNRAGRRPARRQQRRRVGLDRQARHPRALARRPRGRVPRRRHGAWRAGAGPRATPT